MSNIQERIARCDQYNKVSKGQRLQVGDDILGLVHHMFQETRHPER